MSIITVEHLSHGFGDRAIFNDVSFRLLKGEHIGLIGANGEGKSTFMNIITGKLQPDEGRIEWAKNVRIGYLDQHTELKKGMTIRDVLTSAFLWLFEMEEKMTAICDRMSEADETQMETYLEELGVIQDMLTVHDFYLIDSKVEEVARALGLTDIGIERDVTELSGGQRTKVLLGKLLLEKPDVLLLDEPLGALDLKLRKEMQLELKRLQREMNITFVYVTHDQEEALTMSDTVVVMNKGNIQQIGSPQDIYNEPRNAFVAKFIGDSNIVDGIMEKDFLVSFGGQEFACVDRGFKPREPVQVVIRPEDVDIVPPSAGKLTGLVREVIFKGVHFEMHVDVEGKEWLIHSTQASQPGELIGMNIGPDEIHIMSREEV